MQNGNYKMSIKNNLRLNEATNVLQLNNLFKNTHFFKKTMKQLQKETFFPTTRQFPNLQQK